MIFTATNLLDSVTAKGPSTPVEVAGSSVRFHLAITTVGGNGADVAVETSVDGVNWAQLFTVNAPVDSYGNGEGPQVGPVVKFARVNYIGLGTSAVSATLVAFD